MIEERCIYLVLFYKAYTYIRIANKVTLKTTSIIFHHLYIHFTLTHTPEWRSGKIFRQSDITMISKKKQYSDLNRGVNGKNIGGHKC